MALDASIPASMSARKRRVLLVGAPVAAAAAALAARSAATPDLTPAATITLGILVLAGVLWATEVISGVATALLIVALVVACLGVPRALGHDWSGEHNIEGWTQFLAPAGDPVMLLLLGSVALAEAGRRTGLDRRMGEVILRPFAATPSRLVLGVLIASAWLALWTSNTATAALMMAVTRPLWMRSTLDARLRAAIVMAVALGANIGGLGSPVGTPPNAIVFSRLQELGHGLNFIEWMLVGIPIAIFTISLGWIAMRVAIRWPQDSGPIDFGARDGSGAQAGGAGHTEPYSHEHHHPPRWTRQLTAAVFLATTILWVTSPWTHIPVAAVALLPLAVFPVAGIIRSRDIANFEWDVLLLILGGLVLGQAMEDSGLAVQAVAQLPVDAMSPLVVITTMAVASIALSAFMSNTATANLLCPLGFAVAAAIEGLHADPEAAGAIPAGWLVTHVGLAIAMGAGNAMFLPVSTPANALAARAGLVQTRQFLLVGCVVAIGGVAAVLLLALIRR